MTSSKQFQNLPSKSQKHRQNILTQIHHRPLSVPGTGTSINSDGIRRQGIVASICPPPFFVSRAVW